MWISNSTQMCTLDHSGKDDQWEKFINFDSSWLKKRFAASIEKSLAHNVDEEVSIPPC